MGKRRRDRSRLEFRLGLVAAAVAALLLLTAAVGSTSSDGTGAPPRYVNKRYAFSVPLPPGWHRSTKTLVPELLMPREIVALGTFPMPVGGGGNCGREPAAAIRRMRAGDALITIQEYVVTPAMRRHLTHNYPPLSRGVEADTREPVYLGGAAREHIRLAAIPFSAHGRAFDALVYFGPHPTPALRRTAAAVLDGMRFGPRP
jgi:hypothetical protein